MLRLLLELLDFLLSLQEYKVHAIALRVLRPRLRGCRGTTLEITIRSVRSAVSLHLGSFRLVPRCCGSVLLAVMKMEGTKSSCSVIGLH